MSVLTNQPPIFIHYNLLVFSLIVILTFTFGHVSKGYSYSSDQRQVFEYQIERYLAEYEDSNSSKSLWLLYHVLNSSIDDNIFKDILSSYTITIKNTNDIIDCILNDHPTLHLDESLVLCTNNPDLIISYLYEKNEYLESSDFNKFINILSNHNLTEKQSSHISFLENGKFDCSFSPHPNSSSVLDFYFFDFIYLNICSSIDFEDFSDTSFSHTRSTSREDFFTSDNIVSFLTLTNGLFKAGREYDVFRLSQKLNDFKDLPISYLTMRILRYISFSSYFSGYYQYDIDLYRGSIIPLSQYFSIEKEMKVRLDFGVSLYQIGNLQASLYQLEKVYDAIDEFEDFRYQSALLNNLAIVYYNAGYLEDYLRLITSGLVYASDRNLVEIEFEFLNNLHIHHKKLENWTVAYDYLKQMNERALELNDSKNLALVYQSFATLYRDSKSDIQKSLEYLLLAENYARESMYYSLLISITTELIDTYSSMGQYDLALTHLDKLKQDAISRDDNLTNLYVLIKYANFYFEIEEHDLAIAYLDSINKSDVTQLRFIKSRALLTTALAKYEIINNENDEAINLLTSFANDLILRIKNSSDIQSGQMIFEKEYLTIFQLLIDQLLLDSRRETAIYWMDEIKNLSSASFYNNPALKASILSESQLVLDFALRNRIERLRHELRTASDEKRVQLNTFLFEAISEQNTLRRKVLQNIDLEPVNLNRLRRQLGRSDIILYFSTFNEDLYVSAISSGSFNIHHITFTEDDISRINEIVKSLSSDKVRLTELAWFKDKIFNKIGVSDRYTNYFIIPDGFLYHIPFEILPVGNVSTDYSYGEATYLIERAAISYSNSLKDLKSSLTHRPKRRYDLDFVGFGITHFINPESQLLPGRYLPALPLAEKEVEEIATNLNRLNNNIFLDSKTATERNLRQKAGNNRILHFATHSEVFENDPLYSVIYLNQEQEHRNSGDASNDGLVYAYELFQLDLSSEMVMLNSCESGSGNYIQGSGIVGFSRAFNYAGVPSLVMNLWSVRDRSAYHLSVSFYDYLNQGYGKNEAMRKAKIDYINKFNSNPTNWGSFVVYGNVDPIVPSRSPWVFAAIILFIGGISLIAAWFRLPGKIKSRLQ